MSVPPILFPPTASPLWQLDAAQGLIPGVSVLRKFGSNDDVDPGAAEHIWFFGGELVWQTTASVMDVVSTDANDTSAGTGGQQIFIEGLDSSFDEITETVSMNGLTNVTTSNSFIRINRAHVSRSGTYGGFNAGSITVRVTGGGDVQAAIAPNIGQTQKTQYTVPNGKTAYLVRFAASVDSTKTATVRMFRRERADITATNIASPRLVLERTGLTGGVNFDVNSYDRFPEKTDLWVEATASANNTTAESAYDLYLVDN